MMITHNLSLDMMNPGSPARIQVKQGDTLTHSLRILLYADGEAWPIPEEATPVVRWFACDPGSGESARGIYDTLPDGVHAWNYTENQLDLLTVPHMFALAGIVQMDVVFVAGEKTLATFNFEFYVNPAPVNGTEAEAQDFYKVATLDQINEAIAAMQSLVAAQDEIIANLEHDVSELKSIVLET